MLAPIGLEPAPPASDEPPRWRVTLWSMVGVQFIMSISFGIVGPIMPLYLPELGVVSPAAVNMWAGVLTSATSCVAIFTSPLWGGLADRYGRKLMVLRSTLGIAIFTFLMRGRAGTMADVGLASGNGRAGGVQFGIGRHGRFLCPGKPHGLFFELDEHGPVGRAPWSGR